MTAGARSHIESRIELRIKAHVKINKAIKPIPPVTPPSDAHDEWRLDEALAETFPASDPIAVNPIRVSVSSNALPSDVDSATVGHIAQLRDINT